MTPSLRASFRLPSRRQFVSLVAASVAATVFSLGSASALQAQATGPSLVILVRHGEKGTEPAADPTLSAAGQERAKALLDALGTTAPSAIITSATRRTNETAAPLATKYGVTPQVISLAGGGAAHVSAVADAVKKAQGVVVVVGHSNTVPAIVKALGGPTLPDLCDASYATMFVLQPAANGKPATLVRAQYGAADAPGASSCTPMAPAR